MHELALAQAVVDTVAERAGDARVTCVRLEIGKLSGVVVDSIMFCFDLVAEGTPVHGAELEITEPGGRCRCRGCAVEFGCDDPIVLCPGCGGADVAVLSGRQMLITSVEVTLSCAEPAAAPPPTITPWPAGNPPPPGRPPPTARRPTPGRPSPPMAAP
ncbi:hydrogenase maturation nickel metallochaperone HypA [Nonomuraea sp. NPDC050643]|uniref:hydrogenase maturation nickel metallochaperone HypA/HybF n=1 Tax=Nonomuraea sp. NPDC050643 TaxID=3155660 RepID=UPI0033CAC3C5